MVPAAIPENGVFEVADVGEVVEATAEPKPYTALACGLGGRLAVPQTDTKE